MSEEQPYIYHKHDCPHCQKRISIKQAICILNGTGFAPKVNIRLSDGSALLVPAYTVNPNTTEIIDDEWSQ